MESELARRVCAAFVSDQLGVVSATPYKTPEEVGDLSYFLAALAESWHRKAKMRCTTSWELWKRS